MKKYLWFIAIAATVLSGCKSKDETETQSFNIDTKSVVLTDGEEGSKEIALRCENVVPVVNSNASEWLTAEITARMLTIKFTRNETGAERSGILTITPGKLDKVDVLVSQPAYVAPAPPSADDLKVGDKTEDGLGVIYWVDQTNRQIAKAISIARTTGLGFSTLEVAPVGSSLVNGYSNTTALTAAGNADAYPAAWYCKELGGGWYLPSLNELLEVFDIYNGVSHIDCTPAQPAAITAEEKTAREAFDKMLTDAQGEAMNTAAADNNGQAYWSSTEYDETATYYVRFGKFTYEAVGVKKNSTTRYVRCVKTIGDYVYPAEPVVMSLSPATQNFNGSADTKTTAVTVANGKLASATVEETGAGWCTASVNGNDVQITVTANNTGETRSTVVYVTAESDFGLDPLTKQIAVNQKPLGSFKIGDVYKEGDKAVGVVFWTSDDSQSAKIISLGRSEKLAWAVAESAAATTLIGATSADDGADNYAKIKEFVKDDTSVCPMIAYCNSLGDGWYIPAANELKALFAAYNGTTWSGAEVKTYASLNATEKANRDAFDAILTGAGGVVIDDHSQTNGDQYLASTEMSATEVNSVRFGKVSLNNDTAKTGTSRYFRAVKLVKAE